MDQLYTPERPRETDSKIQKMRFFVKNVVPDNFYHETYAHAFNLAEDRFRRGYEWFGALPEEERSSLLRDYLSMFRHYDVSRKINTLEHSVAKSRKGTQHLDALYALISGDAKSRNRAFFQYRPEHGKNEQGPIATTFARQFRRSFEDFAQLILQLPQFQLELRGVGSRRKELGQTHQAIAENKFMGSAEKKERQAAIQQEIQRLKREEEKARWLVQLAETGAYLVPGYEEEFKKWKDTNFPADVPEDSVRPRFHEEALQKLLGKTFDRLVKRVEHDGTLSLDERAEMSSA